MEIAFGSFFGGLVYSNFLGFKRFMGRCSVLLLVTSLLLALSVIVVPAGYVTQQGEEPLIRVKLSKNPKTFTLGATGKFNINEYASGKILYTGEGVLQCSFSDSESMSFSIFVDTFYTRDDATNFAKAMQTRFPEEVEVTIRADGNLFRLEMGKYKSEEEAQQALDTYLSDIPSAVLVGSIGLAIRIGDKLVFRPPTNMELLNLVSVEAIDGLSEIQG
ncbi:MAG: SPOR domain-containing protein [Caldisericia bacterium]